jgi:3',5'-cyclic AMP phosphodiesterase CpdA
VGASPGDTLRVLLFGDNRGGYLMQSGPWRLYHAVVDIGSGGAGRVALGIAAFPVLLVRALVPALEGPRDLVTAFTHRPRGGGEARVVRALEASLPADLVLSTGDLVQDGRRAVQWEDFVRRWASLRDRVPLLSAPGNHEHTLDPLGAANWETVMGTARDRDRLWFAIDAGAARFVILDSNLLAGETAAAPDAARRARAEEMLAWADSALASAEGPRFVAFHHPLVGAGHYLDDWASGDAPAYRERLLRLMFERRVTAVFTGHEHLYRRAYLQGPAGAGFWHLVTGGGGSPLYPTDERRAARAAAALPGGASVRPGSERGFTDYHVVRLELPPGGAAARLVASRVGDGGALAPADTLVLEPPGAAW